MSTHPRPLFRPDDVDLASAPWLPELVEATQPRLTSIARRIAGPSSADDVVQTVYLSLVRRAPDLASVPVWPWLVTAVVRTAYRRRGKDRRVRSGLDADLAAHEVEAVPERLSRAETDAGVRTAIAGLPPIYRDAVLLHHIEGLRLRVVAELLSLPVQTVKTRLRRARMLLRTRLETRRHPLAFLLAPLGRLHLGAPMSLKPLALAASCVALAGAAVLLTVGHGDTPPVEISHPGEAHRDEASESRGGPPELRSVPKQEETHIMVVGDVTVTSTPIESDEAALSGIEAAHRARIEKGADAYVRALKIPPTVAAEADRLGVTEAALRTMYRAEYLLHFALRSPRDAMLHAVLQASLDELAGLGEIGFDAVRANLQGNPSNPRGGSTR